MLPFETTFGSSIMRYSIMNPYVVQYLYICNAKPLRFPFSVLPRAPRERSYAPNLGPGMRAWMDRIASCSCRAACEKWRPGGRVVRDGSSTAWSRRRNISAGGRREKWEQELESCWNHDDREVERMECFTAMYTQGREQQPSIPHLWV